MTEEVDKARVTDSDDSLRSFNARLEKIEAFHEKTATLQAETAEQLKAISAENKAIASNMKLLLSEWAKTEAQVRKTEAQVRKTEAQVRKTEAQVNKTSAAVKKMSKMYGGVSNNQGAVTEEFFFNSLKPDPILAGVRFDTIYRNFLGNHANITDEFDILLVNGQEVCLIEVKYKAHENDLKKLLNNKGPNFRKLFPLYGDHRLRLALASFHINDTLRKAALAMGVIVLQAKGDMLITYEPD